MVTLPGQRRPTLLELDLTLPLAEPGPDPLSRLRARGRRLLRPTLRALHEAAEDENVVGLIAKVGGPLPWAVMQEIRIGVQAFARSGRPTLAWAESLGEGAGQTAAYVLATAFDQIWLQPGGALGALGVGAEATFLRGLLDRLDIEAQFEQRKEYKNAVNQLTESELTPAHREALDAMTRSLFDDAVETIANARRLDPDRVREIADAGPYTASEAVQHGLVDRLGYRDEAYATLRPEPDETALLFADRWRPARRIEPARLLRRRREQVALVRIHGMIMPGRTRRGPLGQQAGSDSVGAELRAALDDDRAAAVVVHIDSPGGSAVASEAIWRELIRIRESGKPLVVSMGAVAASGGYYVACPAEVIVALPATLTGSIGVFTGKLAVGRLLERFGVTTDAVAQGAHALMDSPRRPFTDDERARVSALTDAIYTDFVAKVADGRGRSVEEVEPLAHGRVWTGREAEQRGVVDELGGLRDAARIARSRAGLAEDAPLRPALHVSPLARLSTPKNSEDPRAMVGLGLPAMTADLSLLLPPLTLR